MDLMLVTRAAQSAYNKAATYSPAEAQQNAMAIASYLSDPENFDACCKLYQTDDEVELAYHLAKTLIEADQSKSIE